MRTPGVDRADLLALARSVLLDALEALADHRDAVIVIGAQAVHLRTGGVDVALAEATKDSDVALDPRCLADDPRIEAAMTRAGFQPSAMQQPGSWVNADGIPVDLMVPELLAGGGGSQARGARIPPHSRKATRRARGLEAVIVDFCPMAVPAIDPLDQRVIVANVAGPAALLVAKMHKIFERIATPGRLNDKDAHDSYRILRAVDTERLGAAIRVLLADPISAEVTSEAIGYLDDLFASGPRAQGARMAGRAEEGVGEPDQVAVSVAYLADDLVKAVGRKS
ncbi:hypothetical protein ACWF9G_04370 [Nocardia sp. NPDC055029]